MRFACRLDGSAVEKHLRPALLCRFVRDQKVRQLPMPGDADRMLRLLKEPGAAWDEVQSDKLMLSRNGNWNVTISRRNLLNVGIPVGTVLGRCRQTCGHKRHRSKRRLCTW